jgi:flagellar basal body-associated protein FliL
MSDSSRVILLLVFGVILALPISPRFAYAQSSGGDSTWAVLDVTAVINSAIEESKEGDELREKVVRRFSECSLMYGGLSTLASNVEAKKNYVQAQLATMEVEATIAKQLQSEKKRLELEEAARASVAMVLRSIKAQGNKEVGPLLKNCKALNDLKEIKNALQELSFQ